MFPTFFSAVFVLDWREETHSICFSKCICIDMLWCFFTPSAPWTVRDFFTFRLERAQGKKQSYCKQETKSLIVLLVWHGVMQQRFGIQKRRVPVGAAKKMFMVMTIGSLTCQVMVRHLVARIRSIANMAWLDCMLQPKYPTHFSYTIFVLCWERTHLDAWQRKMFRSIVGQARVHDNFWTNTISRPVRNCVDAALQIYHIKAWST